jgi:predicted amidohydrolase
MTFRAALVQMRSGPDMVRNLDDASAMVREAKAMGAEFVLTPENTNIISLDRSRTRALAKPEVEDLSVKGFSALARELGLWLNVGSLALKGDGDKLINRSILFSPSGEIAARYDKIHLFDVDLPTGESWRESHSVQPGGTATLTRLPWGLHGMTICYDMRFAALYRLLAQRGAEVMTVPSAFTVPTGKAHWHVLLRARAIETGSFVLAAAQGGTHEGGRATFGHSLAVGPWGDILVEGGTEPGVFLTDINLEEVRLARQRIPSLLHDRPFTLGPQSS